MIDILVGLEFTKNASSPVLTMLTRLAFSEARQTLMHVVPPAGISLWHLDPLLGDAEAERQERQATARATRDLELLSLPAHCKVIVGHPVEKILWEAEEYRADLVAVNASNHGELQALFTGSVARALVAGASQSVLICRPTQKTGPLHVILATDHSEYMNTCIQTFMQLAPRGIGHLTVLTVYPERPAYSYDDLAPKIVYVEGISEATRGKMQELSEKVIARLKGKIGSADTVFDSKIVPGKVSEMITKTMLETGADLLIIGAKGHSMIERIVLGSVSFDQAIKPHPYSVLMLRA
jgi:nucleotide-binding universal stress UspA family protein